MTYDPAIPAAGDILSQSQVDIQDNFAAIGALFGSNSTADHYAFDNATSALRGLHKRVSVPVPEASDPAAVSTEGYIYTKAEANSVPANVTELFFRNASEVIQITSQFHATSGLTNGWHVLPGGLILMWGRSTNIASGGHQFVFPAITNYPYIGPQTAGFPNNCFHVQLTCVNNTSTATTVLDRAVSPYITKLDFWYRLSTSSSDILWFAIGN